MTIFDLDTTDAALLDPRQRGKPQAPWSPSSLRETVKPASRAPTPSFADRKTVNIGTSGSSLKLHVLDLGKLRLDKNFMVANTTVATAKNPNPRGQVIDIPVSAYYIEHPGGNILFDTGCHPEWGGPNGRWPEALQDLFPHVGGEECMLPARLDMMGIGPDQVDFVVLSHLHCDHAGCVEYFRKSKILIHEDEFAGAFRQYALQDHGSPYALKDLDRIIKAGLHWREIGREEPDQTLVEGVKLLNFGPGHSRGMLGLQVALKSQAGVILASDACYTAENYGPKARQPGINYDSLGTARTVKRIQALAANSGSEVWFGHDAAQFDSVRKATQGEGFYE